MKPEFAKDLRKVIKVLNSSQTESHIKTTDTLFTLLKSKWSKDDEVQKDMPLVDTIYTHQRKAISKLTQT